MSNLIKNYPKLIVLPNIIISRKFSSKLRIFICLTICIYHLSIFKKNIHRFSNKWHFSVYFTICLMNCTFIYSTQILKFVTCTLLTDEGKYYFRDLTFQPIIFRVIISVPVRVHDIHVFGCILGLSYTTLQISCINVWLRSIF